MVKKLCIISILLNCWDRFIYLLPRIWSSLVYVLRTLEKQVYSQLLGAAFYTYQLDLTDVIEFFYIIFIFSVSIICWERVLKSPSIIVNLDISPFNFITFYFTHIAVFVFGALTFRNNIFSWWNYPCLYLFQVICFVLKSTLFDITYSCFLL